MKDSPFIKGYSILIWIKGLGLDNDICNSISLYRVCTYFWIQNSSFFPDFFQNNNFFLQTQGYQIGEQETLKRQEQSVMNDALQTYRWDWIRFDQKEKNFPYKAVVVAFKKTFNHFFPAFISIFQTFSRTGKLLSKFQDCMNPIFLPLKSVWKSILLTALSLEDLNSFIIIEVYSVPVLQLQYLSFVIYVCCNFSIY